VTVQTSAENTAAAVIYVDGHQHLITRSLGHTPLSNKKAQLSLGKTGTAYTVPVAVLTFKSIQGRRFSSYF